MSQISLLFVHQLTRIKASFFFFKFLCEVYAQAIAIVFVYVFFIVKYIKGVWCF